MKTAAAQLDHQAKKLNRRNSKITDVLKIMRDRGCALHLEFHGNRPRWFLSSGHEIHPDLALVVTKDRRIISCGDALPLGRAGPPAQTWRLSNFLNPPPKP